MRNQTPSSMLSLFFVVASAIFSPVVSSAAGPQTAAEWNSYYKFKAPQSADTLQAITKSRNSTGERVGACMAGGGTWTANDSCAFPAANQPTQSQQQAPGAAESDGLPGYTYQATPGAAESDGLPGYQYSPTAGASESDGLPDYQYSPPPGGAESDGLPDYKYVPSGTNPASAGDYENEMDKESTRAEAAKVSCKAAAETAKTACLMPGTGGMDPSSAAVYTMMMNQLVNTATQIAAIGKNASAQCKLQSDVAKVMGTINGVKGAVCMKTMSTCAEACDREEKRHKLNAENSQNMNVWKSESKLANEASRNEFTCKSYSGQVVAMMNGAMQNLGNFAQAKQCQNELAAFAAPPPRATLPPVATIGDCSDPANTSHACFCTRPANAASAICAGFSGGVGGGGGTTTTPNGSTIASPVGGSVADATDGNTADPFAIPKKEGGGDGKGMGDGGSGAPGGSGLSALGSEGGGSGGPGDSRSAITGTSGGNGSGLGSAGGGGGGGGLSRNNGGGAKDGFFDKFNLRKFLPGSKYKTRGIAGMSVKSVDGITGPMGPSLFEKATRQYQEQIQKQNVILDK